MAKRWWKNILLLLVFSLPACLLVAEFGFRQFFCEPVGLFRPSALLGYEMTPGYRGCHKKLSEFDTRIEINVSGVRDREYPPRSGLPRVLVLGDSVTFGFGVEAAESYPKQLELLLRASSPPRPAEVINAGVWGYNTIQELAYVKAGSGGYEPDVIVVGLTMPLTVVRNWRSHEQGKLTVEPLALRCHVRRSRARPESEPKVSFSLSRLSASTRPAPTRPRFENVMPPSVTVCAAARSGAPETTPRQINATKRR